MFLKHAQPEVMSLLDVLSAPASGSSFSGEQWTSVLQTSLLFICIVVWQMIPRKRDGVFLFYIKTNVCELSLLTLKKKYTSSPF